MRDVTGAIVETDGSVDEIYETAVQGAMQIFAADAAAVIAPNPDRPGFLRIAALSGYGPPGWPEIAIPLDGSISGIVLARSQGVIHRRRSEMPRASQVTADHFGAESGLAVRMSSGVFAMMARVEEAFTEDDLAIAESLADLISTALRLSQEAELRQTMEWAARERLAVDIYDGPLQHLAAAKLELRTAANGGGAGDSEQGALGRALANLDRAVAELRVTVVDAAASSKSLIERLLGMPTQFGLPRGVSFDIQGDDLPATDAATAPLGRIAAEALTNAIRYGDAPIAISYRNQSGRLHLEISDTGEGFSVGPSAIGSGIQVMRDRASEIGAHLSIDSSPESGTSVRVLLEGV